MNVFFKSSKKAMRTMGEVLEEGIYSEIINVLLGCSGRVRSNEMICLVPHCSFSISLDFLAQRKFLVVKF